MTKELKVFLWILLMGIILVVILKYLFPLMAPFFLGIVFACLIEPFVQKLNTRYKVGRTMAVIIVLATLIIIVFGITGFSLITFYQEAQRLIPKIPELAGRLLQLTRDAMLYWSKYLPQLVEFNQHFTLPSESIGQVLRSMILGAVQLLPRFPQMILAIGLGGVTAYFFSRDKLLISQLFYRILPLKWQGATRDLKMEVLESLARFVRVECILALVTASFTTMVLLGLRIPAAPVYGLFAGALDFLPVLGPGMVYIPLAIMQLMFGNYYLALGLIFAYFILLLIRQAAEYKLIGENLNLHPLLSIAVIYTSIQIFGFAGIFFGPLLLIILRSFYRVMMGVENIVESK